MVNIVELIADKIERIVENAMAAETPSGEYLIKTPILVDPDEGLIEQVRRMLGGGHQKAWVE